MPTEGIIESLKPLVNRRSEHVRPVFPPRSAVSTQLKIYIILPTDGYDWEASMKARSSSPRGDRR